MSRWKWAGIAAVAGLVAGAVFVLGRSSATPEASAPTTSSPSVVASGGYSAGIVSRPKGSDLAADGITPIGWPNTCVGAVMAATAIDTAVSDPVGMNPDAAKEGKVVFDQPAREGLEETLDRILIDGDPSIASIREIAYPTGANMGVITHPEWGGYKIVSCEPGRKAVVQLYRCEVAKDPRWYVEGTDLGSICGRREWLMSWGGDPQDWRVQQVLINPPGVDPAAVLYAPGQNVMTLPNPMPAADRKRALASAGPGWMEYADAPQ